MFRPLRLALAVGAALALTACGHHRARPEADLAASKVTTIGVNSYLWRASLDTLSFTLSANVLVMLALGGTGRLYGAVLGAVVFMVLSDRIAAIDPTNWLAALGVLLIVVVRFAPDGLIGLVDRLTARLRRCTTVTPDASHASGIQGASATSKEGEVTP